MLMTTTSTRAGAAPLYAIAIVPDYAERDFRRQEYGAWYIGHPAEAALAPECLQALYAAGCAAGVIDPETAECMAAFAAYLETQGYVVWQTAAEGYVVITTAATMTPAGPHGPGDAAT
jgi:hypothetical protein